MPLVNNNYGLIITRGLGGPACCAIITAPFGLACGCEVTPVPPGPNSGGGSVVYMTPVAFPLSNRVDTDNKLVIITVKHKENIKWRKQYVVDKKKAAIIVSTINFVNVVKEKTSIFVNNLRQVTATVIARFVDKYPPDDKE